MKAVDMRSLSQAARLERRVEVIRLRKAGGTYDVIAEQLGLSRTGVFGICKRHEAGGPLGLRDKASGRRKDQCRVLDPQQEATMCHAITRRTPDQLGMPYPLWTREAVLRLIEERFGIRMPVRTLGTYLARWGFMPSKVVRAGSAIKAAWSTRDYPAIVERARIEDGEIQWAYAERLRPRALGPGGAAGAGEAHAIIVHKQGPLPSLASAVNNRGRVRWKIYEEALSAAEVIDFLRRLVKATVRKIFLVVQAMPEERAESVQAWLEEHVDDIEVFRQPEALALETTPYAAAAASLGGDD
jgi:transposase